MNRKKIALLFSAMAVILVTTFVTWSMTGLARVDNGTRMKAKLKKADIVDLEYVGYNNWSYVMRNNGSYMYDSPDENGDGNNSGGEFPRGSAQTIVFAAGLYVATIKGGIPVVSEVEFSTEYQPGRITNSGVPFASLTAEEPADASQQVYLIDRSLSGSDYSSWPADAPHDGLGLPGLIADAQTWVVFNDLDVSLNSEGVSVSPDPGLGLEVALESFAFNAGPLSDVVYMKFTIKNKTDQNYANSYIGLWMDADVNDAAHDIVGVDTARGLGYVYNNAANADIAASTGFDFFQGPVVNTADISAGLAAKFAANTTILVYNAAQNRYLPTTLPAGQILLGATSFNTYANGTDPANNEERYNLIGGNFANGNPKTGAGVSDYYAFRGDPLGGSAATDSNVDGNNLANLLYGNRSAGADQRILHGCGPFTIAAGSAQEIWGGVIGANGATRLGAVANMFDTDDLAQTTFVAGLVAPAPPTVPKIKVIPMEGQVNITWENNAEFVSDLAGGILGITTGNGYTADYDATDFQGYRVYKSRSGLSGSFTQLAQYDLNDGFTSVLNYRLNTAGRLVVEDIVFGTDSGLRYNFSDNDVVNGQTYYYAVTAYDAQPLILNANNPFTDPYFGIIDGPTGLPISLETSPTANVVSVVPQASVYQTVNDANFSTIAHSAGVSDGTVDLEVLDPALVTGHNYRIEFFSIPTTISGSPLVVTDVDGNDITGSTAYRVIDLASNTVAPFSSRNDLPYTFLDRNSDGIFNGTDSVYNDKYYNTVQAIPGNTNEEEFGIVDGLLVKVYGPPLLGVSAVYTPTIAGQARWFTSVNFGLELLGGGVALAQNFLGSTITPAELKTVDIRFTRDSTQWQTAYGETGAFGVANEFFPVPYQVWDVDQEDALPDRRLNVLIRDGSGFNANGWYLDNILAGDGTGPQQRNYTHIILDDYDSTGVGANFEDILGGSLTGSSVDVLPAIWSIALSPRDASVTPLGQTWNTLLKDARLAGSDAGATVTAQERSNIYKQVPEGNLRLTSPNVLTPNDVYTYSTTANTAVTATSDLKTLLKNIKVVPNPYYGRSTYQASLFDKRIKFTNLPGQCTIRIFTVAGDLVATLAHNSGSNNDRRNTNPLDLQGTAGAGETSVEIWNLQNPGGKFVASGMYIALIDAPGIGKQTVKFAVIQESITINGPDNR